MRSPIRRGSSPPVAYPGARLCSEIEWERAARGANGRTFPHGDVLTGEQANVDETYGRKEGGFGMDEVGSYPHAASPLGLLDMSGNIWEMTRVASDQYVMRGGGFFTDAKKTAHLANRNPITRTYCHLHLGLCVCADVRPSPRHWASPNPVTSYRSMH